ncbi:MAG: DUF3638 domain-containing protein [Gammaproteobacteria bacterium]
METLLACGFNLSWIKSFVKGGRSDLLAAALDSIHGKEQYEMLSEKNKYVINKKIYENILRSDRDDTLIKLLEKGFPYGGDASEMKFDIRRSFQLNERQSLLEEILSHNASKCLSAYIDMYPSEVNHKTKDGSILIGLVKEKNKKLIQILLNESEVDLSVVDDQKENALHKAVKNRSFDIAEMLIKQGADVNAENIEGETPKSLIEAFINEEKDSLGVSITEAKAILGMREMLTKKENPVRFEDVKNANSYKTECLEKIHQHGKQIGEEINLNLKLFTHINTAYKMGNSKLEGDHLFRTSGYLIHILERNWSVQDRDPSKKNVLDSLEQVKKSSERILGSVKNNDEINECANELIHNLNQSGSLTIAGGFSGDGQGMGHAMLYKFEKTDGNKILFKIYNTGDGISYHKKNKDRYQCFKVYEFDYNDQNLKSLITKLIGYYAQLQGETRSRSINQLYFEITPLTDWQITTIDIQGDFDPVWTPKELTGNQFVFYRNDKNELHYAIVSNQVCIQSGLKLDEAHQVIQSVEDSNDVKEINFDDLDFDFPSSEAQKNMYEKYKSGEIPQNILVNHLLESNKNEMNKLGAIERSDLYSDKTYITPQKSGNCTYKVLQSGLLKDLLEAKSYQDTKLIIKLQSIVDFIWNQEKNGTINSREVREEIENAIEKTARFIDKHRAELSLSSQERQDVTTYLETIGRYIIELKKTEQTEKTIQRKALNKEMVPSDNDKQKLFSDRQAIWKLDEEENQIEPSNEKYICNRLSDLKALLDSAPPAFVEQIILSMPIELESDYLKLEADQRTPLIVSLGKYIDEYSKYIETNLNPSSYYVLKKMHLLLEVVHKQSAKELGFGHYVKFTNELIGGMAAVEENRFFITAVPYNRIEIDIANILKDGVAELPPLHKLILDELEKRGENWQSYLDDAIDIVKKEFKRSPSQEIRRFESKINRDNISEENQKELVSRYLASIILNTDPNNPSTVNDKLDPKIIEFCRFQKAYHDALAKIDKALFFRRERRDDIQFIDFRMEADTTVQKDGELRFSFIKRTSSLGVQNIDRYLGQYFYEEIFETLSKKQDFFSEQGFTDSKSSENSIQVQSAEVQSSKGVTSRREILHTRCGHEMQLIKTIDYLSGNTNKMSDQQFAKLVWANFLNKRGLEFAVMNQPQAIDAFLDLIESSLKKHRQGLNVDLALLNLLDLYSYFSVHCASVQNSEVSSRMSTIDEQVNSILIELDEVVGNLDDESKEMYIDRESIYKSRSRLYRSKLLMLHDKTELNDHDISVYLQALGIMYRNPCEKDLPFIEKELQAIGIRVVLHLSAIDQEALSKYVLKILPELGGEGVWKISGTILVNTEIGCAIDLLNGKISNKVTSDIDIPKRALEDPLFKELFPNIKFGYKVRYHDNINENDRFFTFEVNGKEFRYRDSKNKNQNVIQVKMLIEGRESWWQLATNLKSDLKSMSALPYVMRDKSLDFWVNCEDPMKILITDHTDTSPKYLYSNSGTKKLGKEVELEYKLLSMDDPNRILSRLTDFEDKKFILVWRSQKAKPEYIIEFPRYGIVFQGNKLGGEIILTSDKYPGYYLDLRGGLDINEYFRNYLKLTPLGDEAKSDQRDLVLVPNQQFVVKAEQTNEDKKKLKFDYSLLDINACFQDSHEYKSSDTYDQQTYNRDFKHQSAQCNYSNTEMFTEYFLVDGKLITSNQGDALQAVYLYLGTHDYEKAFEAISEYINKEGGFMGTPKEIRILSWLLHEVPRDIYHPKDPRHDKLTKMKSSNPALIATKLKIAVQVSKYLNSQGSFHLSDVNRAKLGLKPWEAIDIERGENGIGVFNTEYLIKIVSEWLSDYSKQKNNIPEEMRLTLSDQFVLDNLTKPNEVYSANRGRDVNTKKSAFENSNMVSIRYPSIAKIYLDLTVTLGEVSSARKAPGNDYLFVCDEGKKSEFISSAYQRANEDYLYAVQEYEERERSISDITSNLLSRDVDTQNTILQKLIEEVDMRYRRLQQSQAKLETDLITLANLVSTSNYPYSNELIKIIGRERNLLTMADLNRLFIQNDIENYRLNTLLDDESIGVLRKWHTEYLLLKSQGALYQNFINLTKGKVDNEESIKSLVPLISKWHLKDRVYPIDQHPEFLLFEAEEGVLISEKQYTILDRLLRRDESGSFSSQIMQLIMGGGKSKVLMPLLALHKARGDNIAMIIVPDALLNTNFADLARVTKRLFNRDIYRFNFSRDGECTVNSLKTKLNQLKSVMENRSFVVMSKIALEDLELKMLELKRINNPEDKETIELLQEILLLCRNHADVLVDEVHLVNDIRVERNFSLANSSEKLNRKYIDININLYEFLGKVKYKDVDLLQFISDPNCSFTTEEAHEAMRLCIEDLIDMSNYSSPLYKIMMEHQSVQRDEWRDFLNGKSVPNALKNSLSDSAGAYMIKEQLTNLLPSSLLKNPLEHYGPTKRENELKTIQGGISKPYQCVDKPSENSRFSSPFETLNYTCLYNLKYGLNYFVFKTFYTAMRERAIEERTLSLNVKSLSDTEAAKEFSKLTGFDSKLFQKEWSDTELRAYHQKCSKRSGLVMYCLQNYILPAIDVDTVLLRHNSINQASQFRSFQGYSGTILTPDVFDERIEPFDYDLAKGTDGETIHHIARKDTKVQSLSTTSAESNLTEMISALQSNSSSIIDVGGTLKGLSNREVAERLAEYFRETPSRNKLKYVLYFNTDDILTAIPIQKTDNSDFNAIVLGSTEPSAIKAKLNIQSVDEYFVFNDQSHTIGIDIKQPDFAHAVITCSRTPIGKFLQGAMRMRGLPDQQTLTIMVDHQMQSDLNKKEMNYKDVINYTFDIQLNKISQDNVMATNYLLTNVIRDEVIKRLLDKNEDEYFKAFESFLFSYQSTDPKNLFAAVIEKSSTDSEYRKIKDKLIDEFERKAISFYTKDELEALKVRFKKSMDRIIERQILASPPEVDSTTQAGNGLEVEKEVTKEKDLDLNKEMEMQTDITSAQFKAAPRVSWAKLPDDFHKAFIEDPASIKIDLDSRKQVDLDSRKQAFFINLSEELSRGDIFSNKIYLSLNQVVSDSRVHSILSPLKKPVHCIMWTVVENVGLRATIITSEEYAQIVSNKYLLPKNSWLESQHSTIILDKENLSKRYLSELDSEYHSLSAQIAFYNCDLHELMSDERKRKWFLEHDYEKKIEFLQERILPCHPDQSASDWDRFNQYMIQEKKKYQLNVSKSEASLNPENSALNHMVKEHPSLASSQSIQQPGPKSESQVTTNQVPTTSEGTHAATKQSKKLSPDKSQKSDKSQTSRNSKKPLLKLYNQTKHQKGEKTISNPEKSKSSTESRKKRDI